MTQAAQEASSRRVVAVVVAAGMGERLGRPEPKALVPLGGRALVSHAVERLRLGGCHAVVVVHPPGRQDEFREACVDVEVDAWVGGGAERSDSVRVGCTVAIDPLGAQVVAIHDAARALVPPSVVRDAIAALDDPAGDVVAAAPGLPVPDTLKHVGDDGVDATVDRAGLWAVHTPQVVLAGVQAKVLQWSQQADVGPVTDDLSLVEAARDAGVVSGRIRLVTSHHLAAKVTWPADLAHAESLLAAGLAAPRTSDERTP